MNLKCLNLEGFRQLRRLSPDQLTKAFEVETSRVYTLPVAYFAHLTSVHALMQH